jgi:hypothetical protein
MIVYNFEQQAKGKRGDYTGKIPSFDTKYRKIPLVN